MEEVACCPGCKNQSWNIFFDYIRCTECGVEIRINPSHIPFGKVIRLVNDVLLNRRLR